MTYRTADHVISTNESYRTVALTRGDRCGDEVTVVRSGPDTERMRPVYPPATIRDGCDHLAGLPRHHGAARRCRQHRRRHGRARSPSWSSWSCVRCSRVRRLSRRSSREQATRLGLDDHVVFTGRVGPEQIADHLSAADVGLCPDIKSPLNDVSTMNKTMEYMAYCLPSVSFDLVETRVSAADTALFVPVGRPRRVRRRHRAAARRRRSACRARTGGPRARRRPSRLARAGTQLRERLRRSCSASTSTRALRSSIPLPPEFVVVGSSHVRAARRRRPRSVVSFASAGRRCPAE